MELNYLKSLGLTVDPSLAAVLSYDRSKPELSSTMPSRKAELPSTNSSAATQVPESIRHEKAQGSKTPKKDVLISKAMTQVLRHSAVKCGIHIRPDGYMTVEDLLKAKDVRKLSASLEDVQRIVKESDKQRFSIALLDDVWWVRANQGHSMGNVIQNDLIFEQLALGSDLPTVCVHGTYLKHWPSIKQKGLLTSGRNHVHFAPRVPGDSTVISGMRTTSEVAIYLDIARALNAGLALYRSANDVILSPGFAGVVPTEFFEKVVRIKDGSVIWSPDSET